VRVEEAAAIWNIANEKDAAEKVPPQDEADERHVVADSADKGGAAAAKFVRVDWAVGARRHSDRQPRRAVLTEPASDGTFNFQLLNLRGKKKRPRCEDYPNTFEHRISCVTPRTRPTCRTENPTCSI